MTEYEMVGWHHRLDGHEFEEIRELVMDREAWHVAIHGVAKSRTRVTELNGTESLEPPGNSSQRNSLLKRIIYAQ